MSRKSFFCSWTQNLGVRIIFFKCVLNDYNSASSYLLNQYCKKKLSFFFINAAPTLAVVCSKDAADTMMVWVCCVFYLPLASGIPQYRNQPDTKSGLLPVNNRRMGEFEVPIPNTCIVGGIIYAPWNLMICSIEAFSFMFMWSIVCHGLTVYMFTLYWNFS